MTTNLKYYKRTPTNSAYRIKYICVIEKLDLNSLDSFLSIWGHRSIERYGMCWEGQQPEANYIPMTEEEVTLLKLTGKLTDEKL